MRIWARSLTKAVITATLLLPGWAGALTVSDFTVSPEPFLFGDFINITNNVSSGSGNTTRSGIIGSKLGYGVSYDIGASLVLFQFVNIADEGVISEIYFDDDLGLLSGLAIYDESDPLVDFHTNAANTVNPGNLPGGNAPGVGFTADVALSAEAKNPEPKWGVGPGEHLTLSFVGVAGDPTTLIDSIIDAITNGDLRIGLHVKAIGTYSESYVNIPPDPTTPNDNDLPVPEPTTLVLLGMGSSFLLMRKRLVGA